MYVFIAESLFIMFVTAFNDDDDNGIDHCGSIGNKLMVFDLMVSVKSIEWKIIWSVSEYFYLILNILMLLLIYVANNHFVKPVANRWIVFPQTLNKE